MPRKEYVLPSLIPRSFPPFTATAGGLRLGPLAAAGALATARAGAGVSCANATPEIAVAAPPINPAAAPSICRRLIALSRASERSFAMLPPSGKLAHSRPSIPHSPTLSENPLREVVQVVLPLRGVMRVSVYIPHMRHPLLLQVGMNALADAEQAVLAAARHPQQLQLLGYFGIGHEFGRTLLVRGRGESSDVGECLGVDNYNVQRLASTHGETCEGAMVTVGVHGVVGFDERDDVVNKVGLERRKPRLHVHSLASPTRGIGSAAASRIAGGMLGVSWVHSWPASIRLDVGQCHGGIAVREDHDHRRYPAVSDASFRQTSAGHHLQRSRWQPRFLASGSRRRRGRSRAGRQP